MKLLLPLLLALSLPVLAQDSPASPPKPCQTPEHRQFDFWIGKWDVIQNDQAAGSNDIRLIHNGCVISENWTSANGGFMGSSLNMYDQARGQWHQTWTDTGGTLLKLDGGMEDGSMVLSGKRPGADGATTWDRISWTPNEDGSVRQHWEVSQDGESWTTAFDGLYMKADESE